MNDWFDFELPEQDPDGLRYYQREAYEATHESLSWHRSCLNVMATGLGKSVLFAALAKHWDGNVLVLAHRDELVQQARGHLERATGEWVEVEQADFRSHHARIVVGSVDSVKQERRLKRLGKDRFQLILVDEGHHYVAPSYRKPLDWWHDAQVAGFTATADRADDRALALIYEDVAYRMDIADGIGAGYLVPIEGKRVHLDKVDLRNVKTSGGDLNQTQLDAVMAEAVEGIVKKTLDLYPDRKGIAFFPGVRSAEYAAERFNQLKPNSAIMVSGDTDPDLRRQLIGGYKRGQYQYLCNCQIATEGFDDPHTSLIIPKLTKSRSLYTQMVGRGTRVLPGTVDGIEGKLNANDRRAAIARSKKQDLVILDFVGNSGRHTLIGPEDVLGGHYNTEEIKRAKKKAEEHEGGDPQAYLEQARKELEELARAVESDVQARVEEFNPFGVFNSKDIGKYSVSQGFAPASDKQQAALVRMGMTEAEAAEASNQQARKILGAAAIRRKHGLAAYWQLRELKQHGITKTNISFYRAKEAIRYIRRTRGKVDPQRLRAIVDKQRQPGEEG